MSLVPKVPEPTNTSWKWWGPKENTWYTRPMVDNGMGKIVELAQTQDFYKTPTSSNSTTSSYFAPWNWNWGSILWYGGIAVAAGLTIYVGVKIYSDVSTAIKGPSANSLGKQPDYSNYPYVDLNRKPTTIESITKLFTAAGTSFVAFNKSVFSYLNPANYIPSPDEKAEQLETFLLNQQSGNHYNDKYWPFTEINPIYLGISNGEYIYLVKPNMKKSAERELLRVIGIKCG